MYQLEWGTGVAHKQSKTFSDPNGALYIIPKRGTYFIPERFPQF